ncbi:MAG: anti-sigma factor [Actinomycetota bacterium]|nr:anti-sigma factor [Actinomycetota bacterium]
MTEQRSNSHESWEELAAGHAIDALEPEETGAFTAHLEGCARCQEVLADHAFVAAQLGHLASDEVNAPSWERLRAGILPPRPVAAPDVAPVVSLDEVRARRMAPRWLSAAAAVVLLGGGGALAWQTTHGDSRSTQQVALASCVADTGCRVVQLQGKATLVVTNTAVQVLPTRLGTPPDGKVYVLWQLPRDGKPTMVATLDSTSNGAVGETHALALPYDDTAAFGLSLEPASVQPTHPTDIVAVGSS